MILILEELLKVEEATVREKTVETYGVLIKKLTVTQINENVVTSVYKLLGNNSFIY